MIVAYNPDYISPEALADFIKGLNDKGISVQTIPHMKKEAAPVYAVQFISLKDENAQQGKIVPPHFGPRK